MGDTRKIGGPDTTVIAGEEAAKIVSCMENEKVFPKSGLKEKAFGSDQVVTVEQSGRIEADRVSRTPDSIYQFTHSDISEAHEARIYAPNGTPYGSDPQVRGGNGPWTGNDIAGGEKATQQIEKAAKCVRSIKPDAFKP